MNREILLQLLSEEQYPAYMIESTLNKIESMCPKVKIIFDDWISSGEVPSITVEGYSISQLSADYGMKTIGAFLTLDWLVREPEKAKQALKKRIK